MEPASNTTVRSDLFVAVAADLGSALRPYDAKILMLLIPDLAALNGEPLRINQTHLAAQLKRPAPQIARSIANLKKCGYLLQHAREGASFTYTLNPIFAAHEVYEAMRLARESLPKPLPKAPEPARLYGER